MSLVNSFETELLTLLFNNTASPNIGDAGGLQPSVTAGSFFLSLHTAEPAETVSDQTTSEMTYTGYARQGVTRDATGWTVTADAANTGAIADNAATITFGENTGTSETSTNFGIGSAATLVGNLQFVGTAALVVGVNVNPQVAIGAFDISLD